MKEYTFKKVTCSSSHGGRTVCLEEHREKIMNSLATDIVISDGFLQKWMDTAI